MPVPGALPTGLERSETDPSRRMLAVAMMGKGTGTTAAAQEIGRAALGWARAQHPADSLMTCVPQESSP